MNAANLERLRTLLKGHEELLEEKRSRPEGIVRPNEGTIVAEIDGIHHDLIGRTTEDIVNLGIALVPEGRRLFPMLTVEENLLLGAYRPVARAELTRNLAVCFETFPRLAERRRQLRGDPAPDQNPAAGHLRHHGHCCRRPRSSPIGTPGRRRRLRDEALHVSVSGRGPRHPHAVGAPGSRPPDEHGLGGARQIVSAVSDP